MKKIVSASLWFPAFLLVTCFSGCEVEKVAQDRVSKLMDAQNVRWESPSENSWGSMPLGNGDIGINFWVEPDGDVVFYVSKTDAWSENPRLLKLGRMRVRFDPNPFAADVPFAWELKLEEGEILVQSGEGEEPFTLRVWIDANHPVIQLDAESPTPVAMQCDYEIWRTERRELKDREANSAYGAPAPIFVEPDTVFRGRRDSILVCHRNERSNWNLGLEDHPELGFSAFTDPLIHRTFGCLVQGEGMRNLGDLTLRSVKPAKEMSLKVYALTEQTESLNAWADQIEAIAENISQMDVAKRLKMHRKWWQDFWLRSWIFIDGDEAAEEVTQVYALQRFMNACSGRGAQPIKFNGSIFTMDVEEELPAWFELAKGTDADFRMWGPMYWWQNTRLIYWNMLMSGDFDLMQPFFKTYFDLLPLARARAKIHYNCEGALFSEVIPWYGFDVHAQPYTTPGYITYYFQGALEMSAMMLDYYEITRDEEFFREMALPFARDIVAFYFCHYPRDEEGKLHIEPAQALETYWEVVNPVPPVAGLDYVMERLVAAPEELTSDEDRAKWKQWREAIPEFGTRQLNGVEVISPAQVILKDKRTNMENPELYAVFPYRRFGLGREGLDLARRTYVNRIEKRTGGWFYDSIMAAYLGMGEEAAKIVHRNFTVPHAIDPTDSPPPMPCRFPAFLGPNYDWVPDQDQPSVAMIALQRMLLQQPDEQLLVLPAWPKEWNVYFKLHAKDRTTVTGEYRDGEMVKLDVKPPSRKEDVQVLAESESK